MNISNRRKDSEMRGAGTLTVEIVPDEVINDRELYHGYTSLALPLDGSPTELLLKAKERLEEILAKRFGATLGDPLVGTQVQRMCMELDEMAAEERRIAVFQGEQLDDVQVHARVAKKMRDREGEPLDWASLSGTAFLQEQLFQLALELYIETSEIPKYYLTGTEAERGFKAGIEFGMRYALLQTNLDHGSRIEGIRNSDTALATRRRPDDQRRKIRDAFNVCRPLCRDDADAFRRVVDELPELKLTIGKVRHIVKPSRRVK